MVQAPQSQPDPGRSPAVMCAAVGLACALLFSACQETPVSVPERSASGEVVQPDAHRAPIAIPDTVLVSETSFDSLDEITDASAEVPDSPAALDGPETHSDADVSLPLIDGETIIRLVAVGDTGEGNDEQYQVAEGMRARCDRGGGCHGFVMLGDNIYYEGPESANDPQFDTKIDAPYAGLRYGPPPADGEADNRPRLPIYVSLGNHDLGGGGLEKWLIDFYLEYAEAHEWFYYPSEFWALELGIVHLISLHTNPLAYLWDELDEHEVLVTEALADSTARWTIAFGHHPYRSDGPHGNAGEYEGIPLHIGLLGEGLRRFVEETICNQVDFYLSGHDHTRQWLASVPDIPSWPPGEATTPCDTHFAISGAGAKVSELVDRGNDLAFASAELGFLYLEFYPDHAVVEFCDADGATEWSQTLQR